MRKNEKWSELIAVGFRLQSSFRSMLELAWLIWLNHHLRNRARVNGHVLRLYDHSPLVTNNPHIQPVRNVLLLFFLSLDYNIIKHGYQTIYYGPRNELRMEEYEDQTPRIDRDSPCHVWGFLTERNSLR